jgi:multiple sugar transport system substrate-binding protein
MKEKLTFSVASPESSPTGSAFFHDLFATRSGLQDTSLAVETVQWEQHWHYVQTKAVPTTDIDVSEVGSTWLGSLADINALRPFSAQEVASIGGESIFSENAWKGTRVEGIVNILSIPWLTDVRVIYYWKDILKSAKLNDSYAFSTSENFQRTIETLHRQGLPAWGTPTYHCMNTVHHLASWIWAEGKDFVSADGKHTEFCDPDALRGVESYFQLCRYMPGRFDSLYNLRQSFNRKEVAVVMDGPWLLRQLLDSADNAVKANLGVALPPGPPFLGGSNLVVWKGIWPERVTAAMALIEQLVSYEMQLKVTQATGHLPVLKTLLKRTPYNGDPHYEVLLAAEQAGRRPPRITLWGQLENSLTNACFSIWQRVLDKPNGNIPDVIRKQLEPLGMRFDKLLSMF